MLKFIDHGDNKHQIEDASGVTIGWISGLSVGFRGFATESDAREGAVAACRALNRVLRQRCPGGTRHEPALDRIRTVHDGAYEWFYDGTAPIARLLRPQRRAYDGSFGVEFVLPSSAGQDVAIPAARSIASATAPYREDFTKLPGTDSQIGTNPSLGRFEGASTRNLSEGK